jgi:hypothetical protein
MKNKRNLSTTVTFKGEKWKLILFPEATKRYSAVGCCIDNPEAEGDYSILPWGFVGFEFNIGKRKFVFDRETDVFEQ